MMRIFVTGSADGLGLMAARQMIAAGHEVILHGRDEQRAAQARHAAPGAFGALSGDLSSLREIMALADKVNQLAPFEAVIHNAGIGYREPARGSTPEGLPTVFAVNTLAPYVLTARIRQPQRLVYLSSGLHRGADASLQDLDWKQRRWNGTRAYADTKLHDVMLAFAVARRYPALMSNALEPGWVATKMGGPGAPDDLAAAPKTQVWLATSKDAAAQVSGRYFYHMKERAPDAAALRQDLQDELVKKLEEISGIKLPS